MHAKGNIVWSNFDAVHASPPCQASSITQHTHGVQHIDLIPETRAMLKDSGLPYVLENVVGADLHNPIMLCGSEFGLVAEDDDGEMLQLQRHRLFESNVPIVGNGGCRHSGLRVGGAYGGGSLDKDWARYVRKGGYTPAKHVRENLLGIPSEAMTIYGLSQSIPPAYTEHIGKQLARML